ncbi:hypothetical protein P154DRAFT_575619 [Amniculicola lignicola CBS 123094]|uniref:F-box domain-containing protein n=1 Tax=Amniculicola lignicola CBS 123094 TaxID=1392246 RepID=A0A6A5WH03_9PLEO|nr:hypothetical protein P154DRAFT_575619 [Amniculicola lignicola CBS 123094]
MDTENLSRISVGRTTDNGFPEELVAEIVRYLTPIRTINAKEPKDIFKNPIQRELDSVSCISVFVSGFKTVTPDSRTVPYIRTVLENSQLFQYLQYVKMTHHEPESNYGGRSSWYGGVEWEELLPILKERAKEFWETNLYSGWLRGLRTLPDQAMLALIIAHAPGIKYLAIDTIEVTKPSFFNFLGVEAHDGYSLPTSSFHGLKNLEALSISTYVFAFKLPESMWYTNGIKSLGKFPKLRHFQHSTPWADFSRAKPTTPLNLESCVLYNCFVDQRHMVDTVESCGPGLKRFVCSWAQHGDGIWDLANIKDELLEHKDTLEVISMRHRELSGTDFVSASMGTWSKCIHLRRLYIQDFLLLEKPNPGPIDSWEKIDVPWRISECLPQSLECLCISMTGARFTDDCKALQQLAEDLERLPSLRRVFLLSHRMGPATDKMHEARLRKLISRFKEYGVMLSARHAEHEEYLQSIGEESIW